MPEFNGQSAVITGGGRGLGRAFAQALAAAGFRIAVIARSRDELDETVASIGSHARAFPADVTQAEALREAFARIGPVDVLVNNAAILGPIGPFANTDFDQWWRAFEVNVRGAMLAIHAALPGMIERGRGRILNIVTGAFSAAHLAAYLSSKTSLIRATECLAAEASAFGVAIFSVAPGTVHTSMSAHLLDSAEARRWLPWYRKIYDEALDLPPERPAALVAALASGRYDALSGLYLTPFDDLDALLRGQDEIRKAKLHALQVRPLQLNEHARAMAAVRDCGDAWQK